MVKTDVRIWAVGMLEAGLTKAQVAKDVGVNLRTVKRWWNKWNEEHSLENWKSGGRPSVLTAAYIMVISKSVHKNGWSTPKLANKLSNRVHKCSKNTVHKFLRLNVGVRSFKRQVIPKINKKQAERHLQFPRERRNCWFRRLE